MFGSSEKSPDSPNNVRIIRKEFGFAKWFRIIRKDPDSPKNVRIIRKESRFAKLCSDHPEKSPDSPKSAPNQTYLIRIRLKLYRIRIKKFPDSPNNGPDPHKKVLIRKIMFRNRIKKVRNRLNNGPNPPLTQFHTGKKSVEINWQSSTSRPTHSRSWCNLNQPNDIQPNLIKIILDYLYRTK